jgi:RHS repeat-associated protein
MVRIHHLPPRNRTQTQIGGDQNGANLRVANYTNNNLNQITSRGVPAYVDIMGDGLATNGVTVNGSNAYRKNEYFRQQLPVTNTATVWDGITVSATNQGSITGHVYVAQNPENYTYDADGNLLSDGRWNYTWDAENRLLSMTSLSGAPSGSLLQLTFAYDYMGRRIQKAVSTNTGGGSFSVYTNKYAYDGWNCVATMNPSFTLSNTFLWGADLSGNLTGAGGVGGLLKVAYYGAAMTNCFVGYDGNGNVSTLISAANSSTVASYEYGPYGELIRCSGPMARLNPCRFSTKFDDDESDLLYYGYRFYSPFTGRWINRDPAEEDKGGPNLYDIVENDPLNSFDGLGLSDCKDSSWKGSGAPAPVNFGVNFAAATCRVTLTLKIALSPADQHTAKIAARLAPKWSASLEKKWYKGWSLIPQCKCDCCPNGVKLSFNIQFGVNLPDPDASVNVDSSDTRSDMLDYHIGDKRFNSSPYSGVGHEVGHLFGLPDEYPDPMAPNRDYPPNWQDSIMGGGGPFSVLLPMDQVRITRHAKVQDHLPCPPYAIIFQ